MKHLGDITKINGAEIEPVDVISGGSPCQDLSVAGKRAGLKHTDKGDEETTRSGLFMEQIRVIKEMREHDRELGKEEEFIRPRYMVWENVPGALSSGKDENGNPLKGEDFRCVLEETAKIIQEDAVIPRPPKEGWHSSGTIILDNGSIAWRIHDSQFWGVPQRRRRICVLADFNGHTAADILFAPEYRREAERRKPNSTVGDTRRECGAEVQSFGEGLSRNTEQSEQEGEETSRDTSDGT